MKDLTIDDVIKTMRDFRNQHGTFPASIKMSNLTVDFVTKDIPLHPRSSPFDSIHGIPLIKDESIPFGQFKIVTK